EVGNGHRRQGEEEPHRRQDAGAGPGGVVFLRGLVRLHGGGPFHWDVPSHSLCPAATKQPWAIQDASTWAMDWLACRPQKSPGHFSPMWPGDYSSATSC